MNRVLELAHSLTQHYGSNSHLYTVQYIRPRLLPIFVVAHVFSLAHNVSLEPLPHLIQSSRVLEFVLFVRSTELHESICFPITYWYASSTEKDPYIFWGIWSVIGRSSSSSSSSDRSTMSVFSLEVVYSG